MVCERKLKTDYDQKWRLQTPDCGSYTDSLHVLSRMSDDKPFACKVPGCNQKFVNEDHLDVHHRKHDMNLGIMNLKPLDTPVIADQTPTPTRFLKNVGDDGLFNDIPSNPFDVEFRKASITRFSANEEDPVVEESHATETVITDGEELTNGSDSIFSTGSESIATTLASSQSHITSTLSSLVKEDSKSDIMGLPKTVGDIIGAGVGETVAEPAPASQGPTTVVVMSQPAAASAVASAAAPNQAIQLQSLSNQLGIPLSGPIMIRLPNGQTIPVVPPSVTNPQAPIPTAVSANAHKEPDVEGAGASNKNSQPSSVKMKLKNTLLSNQGNMGVMAQAVDVVTKQQEVQLHSPAESEQEVGIKRQRSQEDDPETKRQKFLERNRAAASRCRNKRKQWIVNLEKKSEELTATNVQLNNEVTKLRNEVAQLKELLLAHKECPVTLEQRAAGMFMRINDHTIKSETEPTTVITMGTTEPS